MYTYQATLIRVIDGDTVVLLVDLGFGITKSEICRLYNIDAPELRGKTAKAGTDAAEHLKWLLATFKIHKIETIKDKKEKYGRYLVRIWTLIDGGELSTVNQAMVDDGHAKEKTY